MAGLSLRNVTKRLGYQEILAPLSLEIEDREFLVLLGPSGCGKSTLLRLIAGLDEVTSGEIVLGGVRLDGVPARERDIAMVFQNYALYPHMTVAENMSLALRLRRVKPAEIDRQVRAAAAILGIEELLQRKPRQLSGGQRQRVAMGRAIVRHPRLFLFDEPLSNLDAELRLKMRAEIKQLHRRLQATMIYVTHDQVEAMTMADRLVVMKGGVIQQVGTPIEVFSWPRNLFVAGFIGSPPMNLLPGRLQDQRLSFEGMTPAGAWTGGLAVDLCPRTWTPGGRGLPVVVGLRPQHLSPLTGAMGEGAGRTRFTAKVELVELLGTDMLVHARWQGLPLTFKCPFDPGLRPDSPVTLGFEVANLRVFAEDTGISLALVRDECEEHDRARVILDDDSGPPASFPARADRRWGRSQTHR